MEILVTMKEKIAILTTFRIADVIFFFKAREEVEHS